MKMKEQRMKGGLLLRLALSCLCLAMLPRAASAQSGTVTMPAREVTVRQALDEVERQTGYKIAANLEGLNPQKKVTLSSNRLSVSDLLRQAFAGTGLAWETDGDHIVIVKTAPRPDSDRGARSVMVRNGFEDMRMTYVPDPWSRTQRPLEEAVTRPNTYWNNDGTGKDSIWLAIVTYRVNSSTLEADYMDNALTLELIRRSLTNKEVLSSLDYIVITAGSSPEGNTAANEKLAYGRARAMKTYLMWKFPFLDRDIIYTFSIGEDWSGLRMMVEENRYTPYQGEVLSVLDSPISSDGKRAELKRIGGGEAWRYITAHMLPKLRGAAAATLHYKAEPEPRIITDTVVVEKIVERVVEKEVPVMQPVADDSKWEKKPLFAVKTNLLFDAASALNVEIEVPIGKRWSIAGEYVFPWWLYEKKQYALQTGTATLETRLWLGRRTGREQLTGWFLGAYGGGGYYDIEWGDKGYQGEFWHAGLSSGYAHTLSKGRNWRMEYSLGLGYMESKYREYTPLFGMDGEWHLIRQKSGNYKWFGPTRAKISLIFMINHGYEKKGGEEQ